MKKKQIQLKILFPLAIIILLAVSVGTSVQAQNPPGEKVYLPILGTFPQIAPRWIGPEGGTVNVLVSDPFTSNTLYAGTLASGVYKTTNGGANWFAANTNMKNVAILSLAINPKDSAVIYAGTDGQGIFKSTDRGATWSSINSGLNANEAIHALVVNPGNPDVVYAGTRTKGTNDGNLYKSTNQGGSWSVVFARSGNWFNALAVNPNKPNYILAATEYSGPIISSTYGGKNEWGGTTITNGDRTSGMVVAYDPRAGVDRAFFGAWNNDIYRSTNNGADWTLSDTGMSDTNISRNGIAIDPNRPDTIYLASEKSTLAGVVKSTNTGQDWKAAGLKGKKVYTVAVPNGVVNTVYAGTYQEGVFKSTDGGTNWVRSAAGLGASYVTGMAFSGTSTYFSATYGGGILKSTDAGVNWTEFNTNLGDLNLNGLVQHPTNPNLLYALTANKGVRTYNLATNTGWSAVQGLPEQFEKANFALLDDPETAVATTAAGVNGLIFAPSNANIAYMATNGDGVYKSTDSGVSFTRKGLTNEVIKSLAVNFTDPNIVYVSTSTKGVVKRSTDGGSAWVSLELPASELQKDVLAVAMCPGEVDKVCAGTTNGVWKYNGSSWEAAGLQGYTITALVTDRPKAGVLFAGTDRGAFYTRDSANWTVLDNIIGSARIASFNFNPDSKEWSIIYVGTAEKGAVRVNLYR